MPAMRRRIGMSELVSSRPRASRRSSSRSAARRDAFIAGMDRERRHCRLCMAQLRKPLRRVRPCSLFWAYQASMSIWRQDARVLFCSPSQQRKPVAYLICSAAKRRMLGVMWLRSALARSRGRTCQVAKSRIVLAWPGSAMPARCPGSQRWKEQMYLFGRWQGAAGHQELFQVSCRPPGLELVERVVGQRDLPEAELPQHLCGVPRLARAHLQPGQPACRPVHRRQQAGQGR